MPAGTTHIRSFKVEYDWTPGAAAVTKDIPLQRAPIHAVVAQWDMLGQGAAAVIASALTACGTIINLKDGAGDVTPKWTGAELYEYHNHFFGRIVPFQDGTAADNKLALMPLVIPMGRPSILANSSIVMLADPMVGWNPQGDPFLHIEVPADGNAIDGRHLKLWVMYGDQPFRFGKRWTSWTTQTLNTSGPTDWILGNKGSLCEMFLYQTSAYNDTLTADAPTLKEFEFRRGANSVLTDGKVCNILEALINTTPTPDDDYLYLALSMSPMDDFGNCINMNNPANTIFRATGGVADDLKAAFSVLL